MTTDKTEGLSARLREMADKGIMYLPDDFKFVSYSEAAAALDAKDKRIEGLEAERDEAATFGAHRLHELLAAERALDAKDKLLAQAADVIDNIAALADGEDDSDLPDDTGVVVKIGNRIIDFSLTLKDLRAVAMLRRLLS